MTPTAGEFVNSGQALSLSLAINQSPRESDVLFQAEALGGLINLRCRPASGVFSRVAKELALTPDGPNRVVSNEDLTCLWVGPDEWLLACADSAVAHLLARLNAMAGVEHVAATDVSDQYAVIKVAGQRAIDLLRRGCTLDLHPKVFMPGQCARTAFAQATVLLHLIDAAPTFLLYTARSFAPYVWEWLADAAARRDPP